MTGLCCKLFEALVHFTTVPPKLISYSKLLNDVFAANLRIFSPYLNTLPFEYEIVVDIMVTPL